MAASIATVLSAIQALYGMEGVVRQREANEFLLTFAMSEVSVLATPVYGTWIGDSMERWDPIAAGLFAEFTSRSALFRGQYAAHKGVSAVWLNCSKVRKEWVKVPLDTKQLITQAVRSMLEDYQIGRRSANVQLFNKICAIYAVIMISSPAECKPLLENLLTQASATGDPAQISFFLAFSRCVCEEMDDVKLPFAVKDAMDVHLSTLSKEVPPLVAKIVLASENTALVALQGEALACLNVWIKKAGMSLTSLYVQDSSMLYWLLEALCKKSTHLSICAEILCKVITVAEYPTPGHQEEALQATCNGLLKTTVACESAIGEEEDDVSHAITDAISTFCETYVDWILEGSVPEAVAMAELMLFLGSHPRRQIAALTLEFWLLVQEEPVASRHIFFQRDAFIRLLEVLLKQCTYPNEVSEMDELELDDLLAFRSGSQGVSDALLAIFALLREDFVVHLFSLLTNSVANVPGSSWQNVEVCLFAMTTIADDLKKYLTNTKNNTEQLENMVMQIFHSILSPPNQHPLVLTTAAKLVGQFGIWFNDKATKTGSLEVIAAILQFLEKALAHPSSQASAAKSMMQIATSCSICLAKMSPDYLIASIQHFNGGQMAIEDRLLIVEGLTRAATVSPHCSTIVQALLDDSLMRLDQVLTITSANGEEIVPIVVANELQVLSKIVRFLDAPDEIAGGKAVTSWTVQLLWPHLEPIVPRLEHHESVIDALFQLYGWCLQSLRQEIADQLGLIANLIVRVFERHQFVSPLECASVAVDVFGKAADGNEQIINSFRGLIGVLSQVAFQFFTTHALDDAPDVLRSFYALVYRFLLFCPAAILTASEFPVLIELSLACMGNQDRASTNAMFTFVTYLLSERDGKLAGSQLQIDGCVLITPTQTEKWVDGIISALATKSPSVLFNPLGKLLFALLSAYPGNDQIQSCLYHAMTTKADTLGIDRISVEDRQLVAQMWLKLALAPTSQAERRFRGLCTDFAKVCRKELTADALQSYTMDA